MSADVDAARMRRAIAVADTVRRSTSPNPWVGCVITAGTAGSAGTPTTFEGATGRPGQEHAEAAALRAAGTAAAGATLYSTLEPCAHHGRTPPCTSAIIAAGVARVVVGIEDPDPNVAGRGIAALRTAGVAVDIGVEREAIERQLAPYLVHRRTGRPFVVLKLASSIDGRTAAPDGSSRWITSLDSRRSVHALRAESDAVCVGAATVRADDPELTTRHVPGDDPLRVVLGTAASDAKVHPCLEWSGGLDDLLDNLGAQGVLQLLVEGGASVATSFHAAGLIDRYVFHIAPAVFGGDDARAMFSGPGAPTIDDVWRGNITSVRMVGGDVEVIVERT